MQLAIVVLLHRSRERECPRPAKRRVGRKHRHLDNNAPTRPLRPLERARHTQHPDGRLRTRVNRPQLQDPSTRPLEHHREHSGGSAFLLHRVPHVWRHRVVLVCPGSTGVDGVSVRSEPSTDIAQSLLEQRNDASISGWTDVH